MRMPRRYGPYGQGPYGSDPYGPYGQQGPYGSQGPYGPYGGYGGFRGYRRRGPYGPGPGNSCARDACLLEGGCCLAESLGGNCLVMTVALAARLLATLVTPARARHHSPAELLLAAIGRYRAEVSPRRAQPCCRFTPSCSAYAEDAVRRHGAARGAWLTARRLVRCRPGGRRGWDPVPE